MQDETWLVELTIGKQGCLRIDYEGKVFFFDAKTKENDFVSIHAIKKKNWTTAWMLHIVHAPIGKYALPQKMPSGAVKKVRLSNGIYLLRKDGTFLNNDHAKWIVKQTLHLFNTYNPHASLIPAMLRTKFPHSKIRVFSHNETHDEIEFFVQSSCGTACDDFGEIYSSKGEFIRNAGLMRPVLTECADIYRPVCGTNNMTYDNECYMNLRTKSKVHKARDGKCEVNTQ